jgi:hypothetical protein
MAERIDEYRFPVRRGPRGAKYPWDKWLNGEVWRLTTDDFDTSPAKFRGQARVQALKRGKRLLSDPQADGGIVIQAVDGDEPDES